jgi:hypothetical protein
LVRTDRATLHRASIRVTSAAQAWRDTENEPGSAPLRIIDSSSVGEPLFDTVYYPVLDHVAGRPYGLWVHGNDDTAGAVSSIERICTGLALMKSAEALEVTGGVDAAARQRAHELGGTLAAVLM